MRLVWTNAQGQVVVTSVMPGRDPGKVIATLKADGRMPADAEPLVDPVLPDNWTAQSHALRIVDGAVVVDATRPAPEHPRKALRDAVAQANSVADLKAILRDLVG